MAGRAGGTAHQPRGEPRLGVRRAARAAAPSGRSRARRGILMPDMTIVEAVRDALTFEMARDDRVMVLGEDVGGSGGVFRATEGLQRRFGPHRCVDTPLAEAMIIGSAVGLAVSGLVPVAEIQFLGFTHN